VDTIAGLARHVGGGELRAALAERARAEYFQQRFKQAAPLYARCGDAALAAGKKSSAVGCYGSRAVSLSLLGRHEEALVASANATEVVDTH